MDDPRYLRMRGEGGEGSYCELGLVPWNDFSNDGSIIFFFHWAVLVVVFRTGGGGGEISVCLFVCFFRFIFTPGFLKTTLIIIIIIITTVTINITIFINNNIIKIIFIIIFLLLPKALSSSTIKIKEIEQRLQRPKHVKNFFLLTRNIRICKKPICYYKKTRNWQETIY